MNYANQTDLVNRFGEAELVHLTDDGRTGQIDTVKVESALGDATDLIDSYIGAIVTKEVALTQPIYKNLACNIARFFLHTKNVPETVEHRYKVAIEQLERIVANEKDGAGVAMGGGAVGVASGRLFTQSSMDSF
ncbi:MAG: DUF1320 domain-containing protein [Thiomicrospira sp.]|jgi:phage gp36-like protein